MDDVGTQALYERDEHTWIEEQVALLRDGRLDAIDREHLIEFLEDMAASQRRELGNHFVVLLMHMLKFQVQPEKASRSWAHTIAEQQDQIHDMLTSAPGLRKYADELYAKAYPRAARRTAVETGLGPASFPESNPWRMAEAISYVPPRLLPNPSRPRRVPADKRRS